MKAWERNGGKFKWVPTEKPRCEACGKTVPFTMPLSPKDMREHCFPCAAKTRPLPTKRGKR